VTSEPLNTDNFNVMCTQQSNGDSTSQVGTMSIISTKRVEI